MGKKVILIVTDSLGVGAMRRGGIRRRGRGHVRTHLAALWEDRHAESAAHWLGQHAGGFLS